MVAPMKHILDDIIAAVCKNPNLSLSLNKKKVYKKVVFLLNDLADGAWTWRYLGNLHRGVQVDEMGEEIKHALARLHKQLKPRPRPNYQGITLRCSKEFAKRIREEFTTAERVEIFEAAMREKNEIRKQQTN